MKGKVVIVTGASAGIGKVTAVAIAKQGAKVLLVCRDRGRGEAALAEIRSESGNDDVSLFLADFASQRSIRHVASEILAQVEAIDVLVNNAGAIHGERVITEDGLESTFAVNHVGYFLFTHLLLDALRAASPSRIINVASDAHRAGSLNLDDLRAEKGYSSFGAYAASKLANIAFTFELARRLEGTGVTANCLHPGVVATNFGASGGFFMRLGVKIARPFFRNADDGAATSIYLATSPDVDGVTGAYFANKKPSTCSKLARDPNLARALWEKSEALVEVSQSASA